jgi:hypothetical protein
MSDESKTWYRMTRPLFNSGFEDDEFWAYGQDGFQELLDSAIGSDVLIYDKSIQKEPITVRAIVQNKTSDVYNSTVVRQILCNIGVLKCGQYVECEGAMWLVSALPDNNRIYEKAVLWKCKHTIRFISPLTGEIVKYPVYSTNSTQYGTGELEKTYMTVGEDQHLIYIPYNEETIMLDDQFRFLMDKNRENPSAYRITRVDPVSYAVGDEQNEDGLIQWAVLQTQFNEATDSEEFMVADYFPQKSDEAILPTGQGGLVLTDLDGDKMLAIGETKQIQVKCVLPDGTETQIPDYRMEYDFSGGAASVLSDNAGLITLQAANNQSFVGKTIKIRAISDTLNSDTTITIQIVNW